MGGRGETLMDDMSKGRPLAIDATALSASPTEPAFIAPPEGAPVYHGFVILDDIDVDGFTLGKITDFEAEPCEEGDAFVIAPDGSRAGELGLPAVYGAECSSRRHSAHTSADQGSRSAWAPEDP
jgi:hypothetical protein